MNIFSRTITVWSFKRWIFSFVLLVCLLSMAWPVCLSGQINEFQENQTVLTQYMHTFGMDAWHMQLVLVDKKFLDTVMTNPNAVAASSLNPNTKYGVIWLLRRNEYGPKLFKQFGMNPQDDEWVIVDQRNSVVHELIHMIWRYCGQEEVCVSMLAEAVIPHEETK